MIYIYGKDETDYTTLGLVGALTPDSCIFHETANGESRIELHHPLDVDGKYKALDVGCVLRVPVPVRNPPAIKDGSTVVTEIEKWRVKTSAPTQDRILYADKGLSKKLRYIEGGKEVEMIGYDATAAHIIYARHAVYMKTSALEATQESTTIPDTASGIEDAVPSYTVRDQLFRIKVVQKELDGITVQAWHIFYDLAGNLTTWKEDGQKTASESLQGILTNCVTPHLFSGYTNSATKKAHLDWERISPVKALLDPEEGFAAIYKLQMLRDNYDVYFVTSAGYDRGMWIEYGKNMTSVRCNIDSTGVVTRVLPVGVDKDGTDLLLEGNTPWVDADNIDDYPEPHIYVLQCSDDCKVQSGISRETARTSMRKEAQELLDTGVNADTVGIEVNFVTMGDDPRYAQFRQMENVFLWDTVHIFANHLGIAVALQVTSLEWDVLNMRYNSVRVGAVDDVSGTVNTWDIPGGISGFKLKSGSVGAAQLGDGVVTTRTLVAGAITAESAAIAQAAITYANIQSAAIGQLSADAITAVQAHIRELVAGHITTDQLYADLAAIAVAEITTANIEHASIDWATISTLTAEIASIANAQIGSADIDYAKIKDMVTDTAIITTGVTGQLYIDRLAVTEANMVSLTVGELMLRTSSGGFVRLQDDGQGGITTTAVQVEGDNIASATIPGGKLIQNTITARELNVSSIFADSALVGAIKAANIDVANLFAATATINALDSWVISASTIQSLQNALNVWANDKISLAVGGIDVGATNLFSREYLRGGHSSNASYSYYKEDAAWGLSGFGVSIRGAGTGSYSFASADMWEDGAFSLGETYTLSFTARPQASGTVDVAFAVSSVQNSQSGSVFTGTFGTTAVRRISGETRITVTGELAASAAPGHMYLRFWKDDAATWADIYDIKLERGNKATSWSPFPGELDGGSSVVISRKRVAIRTPEFFVDTDTDEGRIKIDENGVETGLLTAPNVPERYSGPAGITVNPGATANGTSVFTSMVSALAALNGLYIDTTVTVTLAGDTTEPNTDASHALLTNISGTGRIIINGGSHKMNGRLEIFRVFIPVFLNNLSIASGVTNASPLDITYAKCVVASGCTVAGPGTQCNYGCIRVRYAFAEATNSSFNQTQYAALARQGGNLHISACTGRGTQYGVCAYDGGHVSVNGTHPSGGVGASQILRGGSIDGTITTGTNDSTPAAAATSTTTLAGQAYRVRQGTNGWLGTSPSALYIGMFEGAGTYYSAIVFDFASLRTAVGTKTIRSAQLVITRVTKDGDGAYIGGTGGAVSVQVASTFSTIPSSGSGELVMRSTAALGSVSPKQTLTADLPGGILTDLKNSSMKGIVLLSGDTALVSGKPYSANYSGYAVSATLIVTYS